MSSLEVVLKEEYRAITYMSLVHTAGVLYVSVCAILLDGIKIYLPSF